MSSVKMINVQSQMQSKQHMVLFGVSVTYTLLKYVLLFPCLCSGLPIYYQTSSDATPITSEQVTEGYFIDHTDNNNQHYLSSSGTSHSIQDPTWINKQITGGHIDSSFIKDLLPDVIVHDSPIETNPEIAAATDVYEYPQSDQSDSSQHTTNEGRPPTVFHQDVYVDIEELLKQLETNGDHTQGLTTEEVGSPGRIDDIPGGNNNDDDITDLWDRYNAYPHEDQYNPEQAINTDTNSIQVTTNPQGYANGHVNGDNTNYNTQGDNTNYNTQGNSQENIFSTTVSPISSGPLQPAELYPQLTSSGISTNFWPVNNNSTSNNAGYNTTPVTSQYTDPHGINGNPDFSISNNNQDQVFNTVVGNEEITTTKSISIQEEVNLGITQQPTLSSDISQNSQQTTQTADPGVLSINTFEETYLEPITTTDNSIYIPQEDPQSTDENNSSNGSQFIVANSSAGESTSSPTIRADISENLDDNIDVTREDSGNLGVAGVIYSTTVASIDLSFPNTVGENNNNNTSDEYNIGSGLHDSHYLETTTVSYFGDNNKPHLNSGNNNNEWINNSNNEKTVTTSGYLISNLTTISAGVIVPGVDGQADNTKLDDDTLGNGKKTNQDHTDSRNTGIILGSTLTIAAVIIIGIMITLCCACLRKNKGDKNSPGDDNDNSSEESYGFRSTSLKRGNTSLQGDLSGVKKLPSHSDTYAIEPGVESPNVHQVPLPQPPQKSSGLGFSIASLTWKRKDKKKKERYNLNGNNAGDDSLTVQDKIKAFEGHASPQTEAKLAEESKPRRKKPKSKAFEEFESTGLIIGFGNPRKNKPTDPDGQYSSEFPGFPDPDEQIHHQSNEYGSKDHINEEEGLGSMGSMEYRMPCLSKSQESDRSISLSSGSKLTEDEGIHTMDSEDDELGNAVPRQTEILKSFRRAPPPRNRNKARHSFKKRGHKEESSLDGLEEDENEGQNENGKLQKKETADNISVNLFVQKNSSAAKPNDNGSSTVVLNGANNGDINAKSSSQINLKNVDEVQDRSNTTKIKDSESLSIGYKHEYSGKGNTDVRSTNISKSYHNESSPVWKARSMAYNKTENDKEARPTEMTIKWMGKSHESLSVGSEKKNTPSWINRNYDLSRERREESPPVVKKDNYSTPPYKSDSTPVLNRLNNIYLVDKKRDLTPQRDERISTSNQTLQQVTKPLRLHKFRGETPPPSSTQYPFSKNDSNNNGASRDNWSSSARPTSQLKENNNMYPNVSLHKGSDLVSQPNSNKYSAFEAEATFSAKGGNYSFYTPNPLEQDSDEDNKFEQDPNGKVKGQPKVSYTYCDENKVVSTDNQSLDRSDVKSSCDNVKREQSYGANNKTVSMVDNCGTPLSGLSQSSEVTYKPSYHPGTLERTVYTSNKKWYPKNTPNYENIPSSPTLMPTATDQPEHVVFKSNPSAISQQEHAIFNSRPTNRAQSYYHTPPNPSTACNSVVGKYQSRSTGSGIARTGYGIARHDPNPYSDISVVPQSTPSVQGKLTYETDDDVFYSDLHRHDSGYYSRQQSENKTMSNTSSLNYGHSSEIKNYSSNYPTNSFLPVSPTDTSIHSSNASSPMDISGYNSLCSSVQSPCSPISPTDTGTGFNRSLAQQTRRSFSQNDNVYNNNNFQRRVLYSHNESHTKGIPQQSQDFVDQGTQKRTSTGSLLKFNSEFEGTTV